MKARCIFPSELLRVPWAGQGHQNDIGADPQEMGDILSPINLGQAVVQMSAGESHTCAVLLDQSLKCWGENAEGQLGYLDQTWQISHCIAFFFVGVLGVYNRILGVVFQFHDAMGLL